MKTFREYLTESDIPTNVSSNIASSEQPIGSKKKKYLGYDCFELSEEEYDACVCGKVPFSRWDKLIADKELREEMKTAYHKNKRLVVKSGNKASFIK